MIARAGIGFVPEDRQVFPEHSVEDNLVIGAKKGPDGQDYWNLKRVYEMFPLLAPLKQRMAGHLSGGEQQMLTIARTLMGNPIGLLLDEPSEGLAPVIVERIGELLRRLRDMGVTVLLAEQNMHFCLGIASHATIIDKGQIVYRNTIEALRAGRRGEEPLSGAVKPCVLDEICTEDTQNALERLLSGVAVVTGAASGIGAACCRELAARGARIALLDRDERVHAVAREVNGHAWVVDVADEEALKRCADSIEAELGPVEILVNSAGVIQVPLPPERLSMAELG